jgi:L-ascorbate metabolism protein UlaG (beta-lactamase superfamily)
LLPTTLDLKAPMDGILISHPHQDHYGLLGETPPRLVGILRGSDQAVD